MAKGEHPHELWEALASGQTPFNPPEQGPSLGGSGASPARPRRIWSDVEVGTGGALLMGFRCELGLRRGMGSGLWW